MREVELKSVVDDLVLRRRQIERAGGVLTFEGKLTDVRYDTANGDLVRRDHVLRLRTYGSGDTVKGYLDWKGETRYEDGFKVREEISTQIAEADVLAAILESLGFRAVREIEREISQFELQGATVRFERYPRMDDLVEVEGTPESIERAIEVLALPRSGFSAGRLVDFIVDFERRTGSRAAISSREMRGEYSLREAGLDG
jgi:predicted adenylyl cyclase CyaB